MRPGREVDAIVRRPVDGGLLLDIGAPRWGLLPIRYIDERFTHAHELPVRFPVGCSLRVVILGADPEKGLIDLKRIADAS